MLRLIEISVTGMNILNTDDLILEAIEQYRKSLENPTVKVASPPVDEPKQEPKPESKKSSNKMSKFPNLKNNQFVIKSRVFFLAMEWSQYIWQLTFFCNFFK